MKQENSKAQGDETDFGRLRKASKVQEKASNGQELEEIRIPFRYEMGCEDPGYRSGLLSIPKVKGERVLLEKL